MGVPGLMKCMKQFAKEYTITQLQGRAAIIDGPALAYFAYERARTKAGEMRLPSYAEINAEAIEWLKELEDNHAKVSMLYFDGALPAEKQRERMNRMKGTNQKTINFAKKYRGDRCPIPTDLGATPFSLLPSSLREALQDTSYASRTRIIPGEADAWCANYAQDHPHCIIFTSDSDLLLYEYESETIVAILREIDDMSSFHAYCPGTIRDQLELPSLLPFAFQVHLGLYTKFDDQVNAAQDMNTEAQLFREFADNYTSTLPSTQPEQSSRDEIVAEACQRLDVRLSEFVHAAFNSDALLRVYLPAFLENHEHASAWSNGASLRMAAYSLFAWEGSTVLEYKRVGLNIQKEEMRLLPVAELYFVFKGTEEMIASFMQGMKDHGVSTKLAWLLYAVYLTQIQMPLLHQIICGTFDNLWKSVQLTARVQGMLYSLRMLQQSLSVWLAVQGKTRAGLGSNVQLQNMILKLHQRFDNFPKIADAFWVPGGAVPSMLQNLSLDDIVKAMYPPRRKQIAMGIDMRPKTRIERNLKQIDRNSPSMKKVPGSRFGWLGDEEC